jgi:hypothetical protein
MEAPLTSVAGDREDLAVRDPLAYLDREYPASGDAIWLPGRQLVVADPDVARGILANADGLYVEHSDFFHVRHRIFGPAPRRWRWGAERAHCSPPTSPSAPRSSSAAWRRRSPTRAGSPTPATA